LHVAPWPCVSSGVTWTSTPQSSHQCCEHTSEQGPEASKQILARKALSRSMRYAEGDDIWMRHTHAASDTTSCAIVLGDLLFGGAASRLISRAKECMYLLYLKVPQIWRNIVSNVRQSRGVAAHTVVKQTARESRRHATKTAYIKLLR
jgi:hypothetical protein